MLWYTCVIDARFKWGFTILNYLLVFLSMCKMSYSSCAPYEPASMLDDISVWLPCDYTLTTVHFFWLLPHTRLLFDYSLLLQLFNWHTYHCKSMQGDAFYVMHKANTRCCENLHIEPDQFISSFWKKTLWIITTKGHLKNVLTSILNVA